MAINKIPLLRRLIVNYKPQPTVKTFLERAQTQTLGDVEVTIAVMDVPESRLYFGVNLGRRGIQPVWLRIVNHSPNSYRLNLLNIDPSYYSPNEAAGANHFSFGRRLLEFGLLAWVFLPLLLLMPIKLISARRANRRMDALFQEQAFRLRPVMSGCTSEGFVFTNLDSGNKVVHIRLFGYKDTKECIFTVPIPGLRADYLRHDFEDRFSPNELVPCDIPALKQHLIEEPKTTTNRKASRPGDPVNLIVVGEFPTILSAFGARWDETEVITLGTCWKTFRAFLIGSEYRYSPVSALYLFGRCQDFALQRVRRSINERLHLRLWTTPLRFQGQPVWVGQVSRDIGVRFTWRTWNLTTHRIDPDVDEARDYVIEDLLQAGRLEMAGYFDGCSACDSTTPGRNLTGDPYYTDGKRAAVLVSPTRTEPKFVAWS